MNHTTDGRIDLLLTNLDRAFDRRSWHGTTLRGALRGVRAGVAAWRPSPSRNSIWQLTLHAAYWKYIARRHLTADENATFPRSPANFPLVPDPATDKAWTADVRLLVDEHRRLRAAVAGLAPGALHGRCTAKGPTRLSLVLGVAAHDLYHAGQIQLLKRLHVERGA